MTSEFLLYQDVAHVGLASILLREGQLDDTAVVIKKALEVSNLIKWLLCCILLSESDALGAQSLISTAFLFLQISPSLALGHFILGNVFGAQVSKALSLLTIVTIVNVKLTLFPSVSTG